MPPDAKGRDNEAAPETEGGHRHGLTRTDPLDPATEDGGRSAEEEDGEAENPGQLRLRPVVRRGSVDLDPFREGELEDAESVNLANREVDRERRRRDEPAGKARAGDGMLTIKEAHRMR